MSAKPAIFLPAIALGLVALMAPALANGFPLVFHDTGAYLARAFDSHLEPGRGPFYGFLIAVTGGRYSLWPVIAVQAAATLWLLSLTLRLHGFGGGKSAALAALGLAASSTAAWGVATVMPDAFAPLTVLAWYVLTFDAGRMRPWEIAGVAALLLLSALVHMTHLALALGLALCPGTIVMIRRPEFSRGALLAASMPVAALILLPLVNGAVSGRYGLTPGGQTFVFGRMLQSGLVARYLDDHCPLPGLRLCGYRGTLPATADAWIWDTDSPFQRLGGWNGYADEMGRIAVGSLADHPGANLRAAAEATGEQFLRVGTGEDIGNEYWHTAREIELRLPASGPAFVAGLQHNDRLGLITAGLNRLYVPLTLAATATLATLLLLARHRALPWRLPATVLIALAGNAFLCGVFSGPHDRYQGRMAWLAIFAVMVSALDILAARRLRAR